MIDLSNLDKTDIRRFCGYPAFGLQTWRFYQVYGLMEFRMNNLSRAETKLAQRYLVTLRGLETRAEDHDRARLFDNWRRRLCGFLGIVPGPLLEEEGRK